MNISYVKRWRVVNLTIVNRALAALWLDPRDWSFAIKTWKNYARLDFGPLQIAVRVK